MKDLDDRASSRGRVLVSMSTSLDGFIKDRDGSIDWSTPDAELFAFHTARVASLGGCLLGRRLYEAMLGWGNDPALRATRELARFGDIWVDLPKVVFSRTLDRVEGNARLARDDIRTEAEGLLAGGRDVEVGGADLAGQAMRQGLVDEFHIFRHPVLIGSGTPLFGGLERPVRLDLVETRTFAERVVYEHYRVGS